MAGGDKIMARAMKAVVTEELRSKSTADHLPSKVLTLEKSSKVPSHPKKSRRGTHLRGGKVKRGLSKMRPIIRRRREEVLLSSFSTLCLLNFVWYVELTLTSLTVEKKKESCLIS